MHFVLFLAISEVRVHQALLQLNKERLTTSSVSEFSHFSPPVENILLCCPKTVQDRLRQPMMAAPQWIPHPQMEKKVVLLRQIMSANSNQVWATLSSKYLKLPEKFLLKAPLKIWIMTIMTPGPPCFVTVEKTDWTWNSSRVAESCQLSLHFTQYCLLCKVFLSVGSVAK